MYAARRKILDMLHDHVLTVSDAEELLDAMEASSAPTEPSLPRPELIGDSGWNRQFLKTLDKIAATQSPVLVQGEPGTGKALIAQMIHYQSQRASGPFIQVDCSALPDALVASELFGHEKGAFTGAHQRRLGRVELARGGTLFLGPIEALSPETQMRLLRLLEEGTFERLGGTDSLESDVRIVAATDKDLKKLVDEGTFRSDLYYQLSVSVLQTAPLRERRDDIATLVAHFLQGKAKRDGNVPLKASLEAIEILSAHDWPGNVAELANVVEKAAMQCEGDEIELEHLPELAEV
jgi:DNA-binding NtrC family response regulator